QVVVVGVRIRGQHRIREEVQALDVFHGRTSSLVGRLYSSAGTTRPDGPTRSALHDPRHAADQRSPNSDRRAGAHPRRRHPRAQRSSDWLAENFEQYLLLLAFGTDDVYSLFPALWNAMLAARGEGVGSTLTRMLAARSVDVFEILGVPSDQGWQMAACVL